MHPGPPPLHHSAVRCVDQTIPRADFRRELRGEALHCLQLAGITMPDHPFGTATPKRVGPGRVRPAVRLAVRRQARVPTTRSTGTTLLDISSACCRETEALPARFWQRLSWDGPWAALRAWYASSRPRALRK